ncbi:MAG: hypothetical protein ACRD3W_12605, partial [Terriglobales bacterium]
MGGPPVPDQTSRGPFHPDGRGRLFLHSLAEVSPLWLNLPVRVAIDIRRMTEFGVGTYTRNIVRALG